MPNKIIPRILTPLFAHNLDYCLARMMIGAAAVSKPEVNKRGSSLIGRTILFSSKRGFVVKGARNCGYARMEEFRLALS